jgi:hypothetical protein
MDASEVVELYVTGLRSVTDRRAYLYPMPLAGSCLGRWPVSCANYAAKRGILDFRVMPGDHAGFPIFYLQNRHCSMQLKPETNLAKNFQKTALVDNEMSDAIRPVLRIPFAKIPNL